MRRHPLHPRSAVVAAAIAIPLVASPVSVVAFSALQACAPHPPGLISWWRLDGDANDQTGLNPGSVVGSGGSYVAGEVGQGFHPDANTLIEVPDGPALNPTVFTIDAWVKLDELPYGNPVVIHKGDAGGQAVTTPYAIGIYGTGDPTPYTGRAFATIGDPSQYQELDSDTPIPVGEWVHLALTVDGTLMKLYQNGVLVGSQTQSLTPAPSGYPVQIGGTIAQTAPNSFTGAIDEIEIHSGAATAAQISAIYNAGPAGKCTEPTCAPIPAGLVSWWKLEGNAADVKHQNPGTVLGSTGSFVGAEVGQGFHIAGPGDGIAVPDAPALAITNLTLDAWVRVDSVVESNSVVVSKAVNGANLATAYELGLKGTNAGADAQKPSFLISDGVSFNLVVSNISISLNTLTHLAATADGSILRIYVNGVETGSTPQTVVPQVTSAPLSIGELVPTLSNQLFGTVDEVELHDAPASAAQIAAIYNAGPAGKCPAEPVCASIPPGLVSWWKLEGNADDATHQNPGTVVGGGGSFGAAEVGQGFHASSGGTGILVADSPSLAVTNLTVDAWVDLESVAYLNSVVVWKGLTGYDMDTPYGLGVNGTNAGADQLKPWFLITDGVSQDAVYSSVPISLGSFAHLAGVADGSTVKIYVNGEETGSIPQTLTPFTNSTPLSIGEIYNTASNQVFGTVDEVELHNVAASAAQIAAIYDAGPLGKCPQVTAVLPHARADVLAIAAAPNPSIGSVALSFTVPAPSPVWLDILDVSGRRVRSLLDGQLVIGEKRLAWDARTSAGDRAAPGVYFARLRAGGTMRIARIAYLGR